MLELLLGLVNLTAIIYFIVVCFKTAKIARKRLSKFAFLTLIFGLFALFFNGTSTLMPQHKTKEVSYNPSAMAVVEVEESMVSHLDLYIVYALDDTHKILKSYVQKSGFMPGAVIWEGKETHFSRNGKVLHYELSGIKHWKFVGITFYSQPVHYQGKLLLKAG